MEIKPPKIEPTIKGVAYTSKAKEKLSQEIDRQVMYDFKGTFDRNSITRLFLAALFVLCFGLLFGFLIGLIF